jgi:hypothetical protein
VQGREGAHADSTRCDGVRDGDVVNLIWEVEKKLHASHVSPNVCSFADLHVCSRASWARGDLNPHALIAHWHLKPACLPFHHSPIAGAAGRVL